jgi:glycosyltransferase involved in cell wall biosynthesis
MRTSTAIVYGKNYDFSGQWRTTEGFQLSIDDALMAASEEVTFTTSQLAAGYDRAEQQRGTVLGKGANVVPLIELPVPGEATPDRILVIANPNPRKRLGDLIEALAIVRRDCAGAHVRVVGTGDENEMRLLSAKARELGLADAFTLAGVSRDIAGELLRSRVVALTSGSEGVPTALLEGMAAGRPVVTTDAGHVRSIVDDGVEGFVVPVGDVAALAQRLSLLLSNRTLAAVMGRRGRERAARHSVERVAQRLSRVLQACRPVSC